MNKKVILHIIDSMGLGGAEQLLRNSIPYMVEYDHVLVYHNEPLLSKGLPDSLKVYKLGFEKKRKVFSAIIKLRKIINMHEVSLVHSHLYWSTMIARMAVPKNVPLITTYHSLLYVPENRAQFSWKMVLMDKLTAFKSKYHIYVSHAVGKMYETRISTRVKHRIIYNFVDASFFAINKSKTDPLTFKLLYVGNFRPEKDQMTLVQAVAQIPQIEISLTLVGDGPLTNSVQQQIEFKQLNNIIILNNVSVASILSEHDLFISSSLFEGFGIAVAEAMAAGLPCLLSDIPAHREITNGEMMYFKPGDPYDLYKKILLLKEDVEAREKLSEKAKNIAAKYTLKNYLSKLSEVYNNCLQHVN